MKGRVDELARDRKVVIFIGNVKVEVGEWVDEVEIVEMLL